MSLYGSCLGNLCLLTCRGQETPQGVVAVTSMWLAVIPTARTATDTRLLSMRAPWLPSATALYSDTAILFVSLYKANINQYKMMFYGL